MRASTVFLLFLAVIAGIGGTAVAKSMGFFEQPAVVPKVALPQVLYAAKTIFKGNMLEAGLVATREISSAEMENYNSNRELYMPPLADAVYQRIAAKNIEAGQIIRRADLEDISRPEPLAKRLLPQMRAVNVSVSRDRSAGALIQTGEWVDVYLTTSFASGEFSGNRTVLLATQAKVITKRNSLWPVFKPIPEDQPMDFTLEVNPYRAALIDFARNHGVVSLTPLPDKEQLDLETKRTAAQKSNQLLTFSNPESKELRDEDKRIAGLLRGDLSVGEDDLKRILLISLPPGPVAIELISGDSRERHAFKGDKVTVTNVSSGQDFKPLKDESSDEEPLTFDKPESEQQGAQKKKNGRLIPQYGIPKNSVAPRKT